MLSIVVCSRNDDHGGNMVERANMFLAGLARHAQRHKFPIELILVEWNPPADRPSLLNTLEWPKSLHYFQSKTITVPATVHEIIQHSDIIPLFQYLAKNVGIRRAKGDFILSTNPDVLFDEELFCALATVKSGRTYRAIRHDMAIELLPRGMQLGEALLYCKERVIRRCEGKAWRLHTDACGDFQMLTKDEWYALRGYPEWPIWSIHLDSYFLAQAAYAHGLWEKVLPGCLYHLDHKASWATDPHYGDDLPKKSLHEIQRLVTNFRKDHVENGARWGLATLDLEQVIC